MKLDRLVINPFLTQTFHQIKSNKEASKGRKG